MAVSTSAFLMVSPIPWLTLAFIVLSSMNLNVLEGWVIVKFECKAKAFKVELHANHHVVEGLPWILLAIDFLYFHNEMAQGILESPLLLWLNPQGHTV